MNPYRAPTPQVSTPEPPSPSPSVLGALLAAPFLILFGIVLFPVALISGALRRKTSPGVSQSELPPPHRRWVPPPERDESLPPWLRYKDDRPRSWDGDV